MSSGAEQRAYDGAFGIPTIEEVVMLLHEWNNGSQDGGRGLASDVVNVPLDDDAKTHRQSVKDRVGLYAELKKLPAHVKEALVRKRPGTDVETYDDVGSLLIEYLKTNPFTQRLFFDKDGQTIRNACGKWWAFSENFRKIRLAEVDFA